MTQNNYNRCEVGKLEQFTLTIPSGQSISSSINMNAYTLVGISIPSTMNSTIVYLQDSLDNINFFDTYNVDNDLIKWTFTQGRHYKLLPSDTASWMYLRVKVDQTEDADRIITIICRGV